MKKIILATLLSLGAAMSSQAASVTLSPTADGDAQIFGGNNVDTSDTIIAFTQSGGLARNAILEFDLSTIHNAATITGATLEFTLTRFVSNVGSNPAAIDIIAYNGDGLVDIGDFNAAGTQVVDTTTPAGGSGGDVRSFSFTSVVPIQDALAGDLLTLRIETDNFASINFAALENATYDAAQLTINYSAVPVPAAGFLMLSVMPLFARFTRSK